jgi:hypothetical protein
MNLPRRRFLHLAAGAAALPAMSRVASAQDYPSRPVRIIAGFAPSGAYEAAIQNDSDVPQGPAGASGAS